MLDGRCKRLSLVIPSEGVCSQWHPCHRMIITLQADGGGIADVTYNLDAGTCLADTEALTSQDLLIALGVQLCEAHTELEFLAVDVQRTIGLLLALHGIGRQTLGIDAQEVADTGLL